MYLKLYITFYFLKFYNFKKIKFINSEKYKIKNRDVVQLVEHRSPKPKVVGSSPSIPENLINSIKFFIFKILIIKNI